MPPPCSQGSLCRELTVNRRSAGYPSGVIPEIDIWRVANLMLNRYGDEAVAEGAKRAEELAADRDLAGVASWRRVGARASQWARPGAHHGRTQCRTSRGRFSHRL